MHYTMDPAAPEVTFLSCGPSIMPWVFSTVGFLELRGGVTFGYVTTQTHKFIYWAQESEF